LSAIADVTRLAGVSTATVSRVLSGLDGVSPRLRGRVLRSVDELGYRPNAVARSLRVGATHTLGLVVCDVLNPFFTELARAVEDEAREAGYAVILGNADERPERQDAYVEALLDRRVDGLLISPAVKTSPLIQTAVRRGASIVCVDRTVEGLDVPTVRADGSRSTAELVDHLVGLGHRRIATIAGPQATITGRERLVAFLGALAAHGLEVPEGHVELGSFQQGSGHAAMRRLLTLPERPTAVFAADNLMALGALQALRAAGLRVPDDMALASFDDSPWFELIDPPITAIAQPTAELGRVAVRALLDVLAGRHARSRLLESRLVVRASCGEQVAGHVGAGVRAHAEQELED
jgi:LacI family transcriptional regulator